MTGRTRDALHDDTLERVRTYAAQVLHHDAPELRQLYRVHPRSIVMAVAALLAVGFLLSRIGDPEVFWSSIRRRELGVRRARVRARDGHRRRVRRRLPRHGPEPGRVVAVDPAPVVDVVLEPRGARRRGRRDAGAVPPEAGPRPRVRRRDGRRAEQRHRDRLCSSGCSSSRIWLAPDKIDFGNIDTDQILVDRAHRAVRDRCRARRRLQHSAYPARVVPAVHARRPNRVGGGEDPGQARAHRRRQRHRAVLLRRIAARLPRGVR